MMATEDDRTGGELAELRAELARFVLQEAGAAVAERPDLGLGGALKETVDAAVRESLEKALRNRRELDPAAFAERVLRLAEAQAAGRPRRAAGHDVAPDAAPTGAWAQLMDGVGRRPLVAVIATLVLLAGVFAAGWFAHAQLAPAPAPAAATPAASAGAPDADPDAAAGAPTGSPSAPPSAASGQPAVLNGVELSNRPDAQSPAAPRPRRAAGGRAR